MFERYTEKARRVIFFARYETSQFGAWSIEPEHLLLGLLRKESALVAHFLPPNDSLAAIRRQVEEGTARKDTTVPTSLELPLLTCAILVLDNEQRLTLKLKNSSHRL
jgi:ATP-dependent Clp protease ATP-binding subunit ClpC